MGSIMTSEEVCKAVEGERFDGFGLGREGKVRKTGGGREGRGGGGERETNLCEGRKERWGRKEARSASSKENKLGSMELTTGFKGDLRVVGFGGLGAAFGRVHDCGGVEERETRRKEGRTSIKGRSGGRRALTTGWERGGFSPREAEGLWRGYGLGRRAKLAVLVKKNGAEKGVQQASNKRGLDLRSMLAFY